MTCRSSSSPSRSELISLIICDERKVMDATQHRFTHGNRQLALPGSRCNRNSAHAFLSSLS
jgi:hypothetical protein